MLDLLLRFVIGGVVVSLFAVIGDMVKPESLGGVFAAAPTIALATLPLTLHKHGAQYAATQGRSMIAGAIAFTVYVSLVSFLLMRRGTPALKTAGVSLVAWGAVAAALWAVWLRG